MFLNRADPVTSVAENLYVILYTRYHVFNIMILDVYLQVLSHSVGSVMDTFGPEEAKETAKFILLMDKFFDCLNTRLVLSVFERNAY